MLDDVVVVGGGGSGLAAAISAAEAGATVTLLEKNPQPGGTTACSIGSISASGTPHQRRAGIADNPQDHYEDMGLFPQRDASKPRTGNDALHRILADNVPDTFRWLCNAGVSFFGPNEEQPHRRPRMHNVMPNSRAYIYHLERLARRRGVKILTNARASHFVTENGEVVGVEFSLNGTPQVITARRGVVLASGDYAGDPVFRKEFMNEDVARLEPVNPQATGDGHRMALEIGGRILNSDLWSGGMRFVRPARGPWMTRLPPYRWLMGLGNFGLRWAPGSIVRHIMMSFLTTVLVPTPKLYKAGAIIVNKNGERFADETKGIPYALALQPDAVGYIVFDAAIAGKFAQYPNYLSTAPGIAYAYLKDYKRTRPDLYHQADTLEDLALQLHMPPQALAATVEAYNRSNEIAGKLPPRGDRAALTSGPYYALGPCRNFIHYTDGGLAIDTEFRLLGQDDKPIPRLFAVGNAGQGGAFLRGHGHHLGWAFTSGRLAGRKAAALPARPL